MRALTCAAIVVLALCWEGCSKKAPIPVARVPPDDIWASMRQLEKLRKEVDRGLTTWDATLLADSATALASEIKSFPDKYEKLSPEFLKYASAVQEKAEGAAGAVRNDDFAGARASWGEALKACQRCHQAWQGPKTGYQLPPETERPPPPPPPVVEAPPVDPNSQPANVKKKGGKKKAPKKATP
jgi:cytochrome c556